MSDTPPDELAVTFRLTADDVRAIAKRLLWRQHRSTVLLGAVGILAWLGWAALMTYVPALTPPSFAHAEHTPLFAYGLPVLVVIPLVAYLASSALDQAVKRAKRVGTVDAEHFVKITKDGVTSRATKLGETARSWKQVSSVEGRKDFIFIYGRANEAQAIPRRAFAPDAEATRFLDRAQAWFEAQNSSRR